jgi:hypothetical protein
MTGTAQIGAVTSALWTTAPARHHKQKGGPKKGKLGTKKQLLVFVFFHVTTFVCNDSWKLSKNGETICQNIELYASRFQKMMESLLSSLCRSFIQHSLCRSCSIILPIAHHQDIPYHLAIQWAPSIHTLILLPPRHSHPSNTSVMSRSLPQFIPPPRWPRFIPERWRALRSRFGLFTRPQCLRRVPSVVLDRNTRK